MSPTAIAKAADLLQAVGEEVSIRAVCRVLKAANGKAARWSQVRAVIKAWESSTFIERATPGQHPGNTLTRDGQQALPARDNCNSNYVDSLRSSTRNGEPKRERAIKLPFDREILDRRNAILKAVWGCVQPHIGRATTFTAWRDRNAKSARSLAEAGVDAARAVAAWEVACRKYGEPVRQLSAVQDTLAWYEANKERQHA